MQKMGVVVVNFFSEKFGHCDQWIQLHQQHQLGLGQFANFLVNFVGYQICSKIYNMRTFYLASSQKGERAKKQWWNRAQKYTRIIKPKSVTYCKHNFFFWNFCLLLLIVHKKYRYYSHFDGMEPRYFSLVRLQKKMRKPYRLVGQ